MLTPLQAAIVVTTLMASPAAVLGIPMDEDCKCFMCVCDLDPHPEPPEVPTTHHAPPVPSPPPPPPSPSPPPPAPVVVPAYYPPPTTGYYYYPPQPYGYPWPTTTYGSPAGEMYPRDDRRRESKSGAARPHGGSRLVLAVALASAVLSLLLLPAVA